MSVPHADSERYTVTSDSRNSSQTQTSSQRQIITCAACGARNRADPQRLRNAVCGNCGAGLLHDAGHQRHKRTNREHATGTKPPRSASSLLHLATRTNMMYAPAVLVTIMWIIKVFILGPRQYGSISAYLVQLPNPLEGSLIILGVSLLAIVVVLSFILLTSRWRSPRVFISYGHADEEDATHLRRRLEALGLKAEHLPFKPSEHDTVVSRASKQVSSCDLLISLSSRSASFAEAEIFGAVVAKKPIIILADGLRDLPATAYRGYPVFEIGRLKKKGYEPLATFIRYVHGHISHVPMLVRESMEVSFIVLLVVLVSLYILTGILSLVAFVDLDAEVALQDFVFHAAIVVLALGFILTVVYRLLQRWQVRRITRQQIMSGQYTQLALKQLANSFDEFPGLFETLLEQPLERRSEDK